MVYLLYTGICWSKNLQNFVEEKTNVHYPFVSLFVPKTMNVPDVIFNYRDETLDLFWG